MKVKELIAILKTLNPEQDVVMEVDRDPDFYGLCNIEVNGKYSKSDTAIVISSLLNGEWNDIVSEHKVKD